jgi:MATE family multidrug resistance protein
MARSIRSVDAAEHQSPFSRSFTASSPIAASAIARDLAEYSDEDHSTDEISEYSTARPPGSWTGTNPQLLAGSYRRPGQFMSVSHGTVIPIMGSNSHSPRASANKPSKKSETS